MSSTSDSQRISETVNNTALASNIVTPDEVNHQKSSGFPSVTDQEKGFANEYLLNGYNHRAAALAVGIAESSAIRVKRKPLVAAYIEFLQERMYASNFVSKGFIDAKLDDLYEMAIGDVNVPMVLGDGSTIEAKKFQGGLALQILQERSKMHGIVVEEKSNSNMVTVNIDLGMALGQKDMNGVTIEGKYKDA
jgi:hypothetical protein